jgi:hypothetical protein
MLKIDGDILALPTTRSSPPTLILMPSTLMDFGGENRAESMLARSPEALLRPAFTALVILSPGKVIMKKIPAKTRKSRT